MRTKVLVLMLTIVYFCPIFASAETTKIKQNFVSRSEFQGHHCCPISRVGGWTKHDSRKRTPKKEIAVSKNFSETKNKTQD